jgi:hypothetical protein
MGILGKMKGSKYRCVDAHLHVVDFLQDSAGLGSCAAYMDQANISHAVAFGLPVTKIWADIERMPPTYYLGDDSHCYYYSAVDFILAMEWKTQPEEVRQRFFPMIGGFNPVDKYAYKHIERVIKHFPGMWHGIGEILFRHDDLTNLTYGDTPRCNHTAMDAVYDLCADTGLPICIHQNLTSVGTSTHPLWLHEIEQTLQHHPKTTIVWAHCGVSRRVYTPVYHKIVRRLMQSYQNLYCDLSWVVFDDFIAPGGTIDENWVQLAEDFSNRLCIGTDVVNKFEFLAPTIHKYDLLLDLLGEEARENLIKRTAFKLYGKAIV